MSKVTKEDKIRNEYVKGQQRSDSNNRRNDGEQIEMARACFKEGRNSK